MNSIRNIAKLNELELQKVTPSNASWHTDYRDTAYVYIGGIPFELSEGDVLTIFSQYGTPTHINLMRDRETGKSRGFAFLKYADQKSTDLAVDNLSGASVLGKVLSVDHTRYKLKDGERETVGDDEEGDGYGTDQEGDSRRKRGRSESESEEERPMVKEEMELAKLMREHDVDDPMKAYLIEQKKAEVEEALKAVAISRPKHKSRDEKERRHRHHHRHSDHKDRDREEREGTRSNGHRSRKHRERDEEDEERSDKPRSSRRQRSTTPEESDDHGRKHRSRRPDSESDDDYDSRRKDRRSRRKRDESEESAGRDRRHKR